VLCARLRAPLHQQPNEKSESDTAVLGFSSAKSREGFDMTARGRNEKRRFDLQIDERRYVKNY
jgi:hypothetical protein